MLTITINITPVRRIDPKRGEMQAWSARVGEDADRAAVGATVSEALHRLLDNTDLWRELDAWAKDAADNIVLVGPVAIDRRSYPPGTPELRVYGRNPDDGPAYIVDLMTTPPTVRGGRE